jgi:hypothetical protein
MLEYSKVGIFPKHYEKILVKASNNSPIWFTWNNEILDSENPFSFYKNYYDNNNEGLRYDKKELFRVSLGLGNERFDKANPIDKMLLFVFKYADAYEGLKNKEMSIYRPTICDSNCYVYFRYNKMAEPYGCTYLINNGKIKSGVPQNFYLKNIPTTRGYQEIIGEPKFVNLSHLHKLFIV